MFVALPRPAAGLFDLAKAALAHVVFGRPENRGIGNVVQLRPELKRSPLGDVRHLGDAQIDALLGRTDDRVTAQVAELGSGALERRGIQISADAGVYRALGLLLVVRR